MTNNLITEAELQTLLKIPESAPDWRQARCAQAVEAGAADPNDWFPENRGQRDVAKAFCADCPIKKECLAYGKANDLVGIWGRRLLGYKLETPEEIKVTPTRRVGQQQTHCQYGHLKTQRKPNGQLRCAVCNRRNGKKSYDKQKAQKEAA